MWCWRWMISCVCINLWVSAGITIIKTSNAAEVVNLGVNWGGMASHQMLPSTVVQMIKDNGIKKVKLFESDSWTVSSLAGTGLEVMVAIPNDKLSRFSGKFDHAKDWVKNNVSKHMYDGGVNIKYVAVGNEPFLKSYNGSFMKTTFPALQNIQKALDEAGLGDKIKATIPLNADVYESANDKPSGGKFRDDIKDLMHQIVKFLHDNKAPFVVNIYPFLSLYQNQNFPFDFAFFDGGGKSINDNGVQYTNVFDANYDTLVYALKKAGVPDLKIIVGEVGWPTDGDKNATPDLAKKFYNGFLKRMANKKGTPLRPGHLDVYLFSLIDEDQKSIAPGDFERHWGIFRYDGQPKFPIDLTGQGHEKYLVGAKGVEYLTKQWCVFNKEKSNEMNTVPDDMNYACSLGDCTALGYGSSCNNLDVYGNISYAFNMYFQMQDQDVQACDFHGTAKLTTENASTGSCLFPVQIVNAGERMEFMTLTSTVLLSLIVLAFL
ncbi:Glycoside hydrolase [Macleaya cordata]|uniref:glucan endo-1,3-beta-D-glucosidase n=1 Tax=Macleaya cordata TaxID=56857 RepID=A0A200QCM2_MACCD|nr:Glycoside hydrolase [Macleaya cordata]